MVDYVWLWEDEGMGAASQKGNVPLSVTPSKQAYKFPEAPCPGETLGNFRLGARSSALPTLPYGVAARHCLFVPERVLSHGWDPVSEEYGKLEGRERWPILWLEDDKGMWQPQFYVARFVRDMDLAEQYGCQGVLGIHWRRKVMDINAGFQSGYSWNKKLTPATFFQGFASAQARTPKAPKLAKVLEDTDRDRPILCSWTGRIENGHGEAVGYSPDYVEAFPFWAHYEPPDSVKKSQAEVAQQLRALTDAASSSAERERSPT